ncbi:MAG: DNA repair protein RadA [Acidimicrobiia bacterium]|jgi:DNA repair protein RadA/Sms
MTTRARTRSTFRCSECASETPQWLGRCPACDAWGTLAEVTVAARPVVGPTNSVLPIVDVAASGAPRCATGISELDRVLGGGFTAGSTTLFGGEPGIGKSTLLLQALGRLAASGRRCLLVGAEESPEQVRGRAERLGVLHPDLWLVAESSLPHVIAHAEALRPDVLAVDSVQTLLDPDLPGTPGSVTQVRECASRLTRLAREQAMATILVGHVTKDGSLAGPRQLEHVVDTVCSFEGDRYHGLRFLRARKHRFGSTREVGIFEMTEDGLVPVPDASALFLADRREGSTGSVVAATVEGARPVLVEVQALVAAVDDGGRRVATGVDANRLSMLLAVLERHAGVDTRRADVYASVAGGVRIAEPGVDLAVLVAVAGVATDRVVAPRTVLLGEVGLGGEIRGVAHAAVRVAEAARLGFTRVIGPSSVPAPRGVEVVAVDSVADALAAAFGAATV